MGLQADVKAWHSKLCDMSTHEIVLLMRDEKVRGHRQHSQSCAVSRLIRQKTGEYVTTTTAVLREPRAWWDEEERAPEELYHSESLAQFIVDFDAGVYPELTVEGWTLNSGSPS